MYFRTKWKCNIPIGNRVPRNCFFKRRRINLAENFAGERKVDIMATARRRHFTSTVFFTPRYGASVALEIFSTSLSSPQSTLSHPTTTANRISLQKRQSYYARASLTALRRSLSNVIYRKKESCAVNARAAIYSTERAISHINQRSNLRQHPEKNDRAIKPLRNFFCPRSSY